MYFVNNRKHTINCDKLQWQWQLLPPFDCSNFHVGQVSHVTHEPIFCKNIINLQWIAIDNTILQLPRLFKFSSVCIVFSLLDCLQKAVDYTRYLKKKKECPISFLIEYIYNLLSKSFIGESSKHLVCFSCCR